MPSAGDNAMSEKEWQAKVVEYARAVGWKVWHFHDSRRDIGGGRMVGDADSGGFPDLVIVRGRRLIFAELKSQKGKVTEVQWQGLQALMAVAVVTKLVLDGPGHRPQVVVQIWRPGDWETVMEVLD